MEPAKLRSHPELRIAGENADLWDESRNTKNDEKTTRRGKLKVRIHNVLENDHEGLNVVSHHFSIVFHHLSSNISAGKVGELRNTLSEIEEKLFGLTRKLEATPIGEQRCLKRSLKPILKSEPIKCEIAAIGDSDFDADEKDIVPEKDVGFILHKSLSKLPVLDKSKYDEMPKVTTDILTKVVGLETLYGVLMEEHLGLQLSLQDTSRRLRAEERRAREFEERRNPINLALAERLGLLQTEVEGLRRTVAELREENDHLEFRLLEMDEIPIRKTVYRSAESTRYDPNDIDDVSDSGVMSLPASDDEHTDLSVEAKSEGDVKGRLLSLSQNSAVGDRICIQQGLALLRHYEARIEALESTIAAMCHEATLSRNVQSSDELRGSTGRIIATVLPFTERKDCCLQESGIFEEGEADWASRGTQTEEAERHGDLSTELEKLSRIREKMETASLQPQELPPGKQLAYYRARVETLESRLEVYQARPDEATKLVKARLEKEARLEADLDRLREKVVKMELENRELEEERCELEEAENDTRLRCQKLEFKLGVLGEKKNCLKAQLEQLSHEMEAQMEDKKKTARMELLVQNYEKKNKELEERELDLRYKLQMLENTMPALMMWNVWRMMSAMQGQNPVMHGMLGQGGTTAAPSNTAPIAHPTGTREEELLIKLQALETRLNAENKMLEESRNAEDVLRSKVRDLEEVLDTKDTNILHVLERDPGKDIQAFEKLSKMAKERVDMDRRIKDLERKEKMYQETMQQVEVLYSDMEGNYAKQLQEKDDLLYDKEHKLAESEHKLRQNAQISEMNLQLQEKLNQLELEMNRLNDALKKREMEREGLENEERRLNTELQECLQELDTLKKQIEGPMKGQLEVQRKRAAALEEDLEKAHNQRIIMESEHKDEVSLLERRIHQLHKELLESDVTIGELREEVQTLEIAIDDLKNITTIERSDNEEIKKSYEAKIEEKERLFEELKESMKIKPPEKSLKDEFEELMPKALPEIVTKLDDMPNKNSKLVEKKPEEPEQPLPKGDYRRPPSIPLKPGPKEVPESCDQINDSVNTKMTDKSEDKNKIDIKNKTVHAIEDIIKEIDRGEPLLDFESTKGILSDISLKHQLIPLECQLAHKAVSSSSGKDVNGKVDNLTEAFKHSKVCKSCNETLEAFLSDLIKELGVRLPSSNLLGNH